MFSNRRRAGTKGTQAEVGGLAKGGKGGINEIELDIKPCLGPLSQNDTMVGYRKRVYSCSTARLRDVDVCGKGR